ncbi:MAG: large conductance mechanosensitive channel protein MscL [Anaerolinea sp.]|nr:large conductance mechanosensitive channel protein MscL [Anaerolinea sp.]
MIKEFREFIMRGNVLDLAVGIIIGAAFTAIVGSLVADLITPIIGLVTGGINFSDIFTVLRDGTPAGPYVTLADAQAAGAVTLNWGLFFNAVINFVIVAFVLFLIIRSFNRLQSGLKKPAPAADPTTKECPYCYSTIAIKATRCPNCTSEQPAK